MSKNSFNGVFSDSDDEKETIPNVLNTEIKYNFQEKYNTFVKKYHTFVNNPDFIKNKGDKDTNFVDMYTMFEDNICTKSYQIPDDKIPRLFKYIEICRRENTFMMCYEKQLEYSGIMFDFDILKKTKSKYLDQGTITSIYHKIVSLLRKYVDLSNPFKVDRNYGLKNKDKDKEGKEQKQEYISNPNSIVFHMACIKKPKIKFLEDKNAYKDGFHILIPGIQITRKFKRFLINKIKEDCVFESIFSNVDLVDSLGPNDVVDTNSAHVPVFLLGSSSKLEAPPYYVHSIVEVELNPKYIDDPLELGKLQDIRDLKFGIDNNGVQDKENKIISAHEFSLNWECPNGIIKKFKYEPKDQYIKEIGFVIDNQESHEEREYGALSILSMHDPEVKFIEELLNTLDEERYTDYNKWFSVLCVLAHTSKSYKPLAEKFSMKCEGKYNPMDFEHHWQSALSNKEKQLSIGSLHFWAKSDNLIKYTEISKNNIYNIIYKKIYNPQLEGNLQHYDIATILHTTLKDKYVYDSSGTGIWYEFVINDDPQVQGEIYKWRAYPKPPNSLRRYISEVLPVMFEKIFDQMNANIEDAAGNENSKYHVMIRQNLKITCRKLRDNSFKNGVVRECEQKFEVLGFTDKLDKLGNIMGVGNGILKFSDTIEFIDGYHNYPISKHTEVDYVEFNPYEPITKKLICALRNLFPENEPDTMQFVMCYLASALDGKKKESLLALLVGGGSNGKSFLIELFRETIGKYGVKMPMSFLTSRQKDAENASPALMALMDARAALYSETSKNEILQMAKVKEVTGNEAMAGRKLHQDQMNFKPKCIHIASMNYEFETGGNNDHGTWRRLLLIRMMIKFCKEGIDDYDPNNPLERLADPTMQAQWPEDPEVKSAFLSILCWYYEILHRQYSGIVENVPHPTVKRNTEAYRDRQDKINKFINIKFVKTVDKTIKLPMFTIIEKYTRWYDALYPDDKFYKKSLAAQLENSKLVKLIKRERDEVFITGYRILDNGEEAEEGEIYLMDELIDNKKKDYVGIVSETTEEFYKRICEEYDEKKQNKLQKIKEQNSEIHKQKMEVKKANAILKASGPTVSSGTNVGLSTQPDISNKIEYDKSGFKVAKKNNNMINGMSKNDIKELCDSDSSSDSDSD
jgi:phage/plasmid-associated DNA primase